MNTIFLLVSFFLLTVEVRSKLEANMEHFVMTEAHISQYRTNEDKNTGYAPFYMKCSYPEDKYNCQPAIPHLSDEEGNVIISGFNISYGCPQKLHLKNVLNPGNHFQNALIMKRAKITQRQERWQHTPSVRPLNFLNVYQYRCTLKVSPILWKIQQIENTRILYGIGFLVPGFEAMSIAQVNYDPYKHIPIWTKHTVHGVSLAAPIMEFNSTEIIEYQDDSEENTRLVQRLKKVIKSYYEFNENRGNDEKMLNGWYRIPQTIKIVLGHLIPDYDMVTSNWKKVSQFAQTIAPTWEDLYLNEWIDVEEMIREISFMREKQLTVFSGTHGQLTFDITAKETQDKPKFYLGDGLVSFPEIFWKLVIDETMNREKATVIIFRNVTKQLEELKIFTEFEPPCNSICSKFLQKTEEPHQLIYCCKVSDVQNKIKELPEDVLNKSYEVLIR